MGHLNFNHAQERRERHMATTKERNTKKSTYDVKEIVSDLEEKIQELFQSDDYLSLLQKMSLLHDYSFHNIILILLQCPKASMIASYTTFNKMHRQVLKGSKAIKILCPCTAKYKKEVANFDENGNSILQEVEEQRTYFKLGNVFDVSQTVAIDETGEIPTFTTTLSFDSDFISKLICGLKKSQTIPIMYDPKLTTDSANGYYRIDTKEIFLKEGMSNLQELKTLVHELSHHYQYEHYKDLIKDFNKHDLEVSAESTAYVVLRMLRDFYGVEEIDSSKYSIGYVAGWSKDKNLKELKTTLTLISKISNDLFKAISTAIPQLS